MICLIAVLTLSAQPCYLSPVSSPVVDAFRAPACYYCPGNRGLEYQPVAGSPVVAAASGVVTYNGVVAGVRYVIVSQADGRTATYGRLRVADVVAGDSVLAGGPIGTTTERFYFGLRQGNHYVDPAPYLGVVHFRRRLIPTDGGAPRRAPPPIMSCSRPP